MYVNHADFILVLYLIFIEICPPIYHFSCSLFFSYIQPVKIWEHKCLSRKYLATHYEKQRRLLKKVRDTRNTVHRTVTPPSPSEQAPGDLTPSSQWPPAAPSYFPESHQWSEISFLSKVILIWGKARSCWTPSLGWRGAESPG